MVTELQQGLNPCDNLPLPRGPRLSRANSRVSTASVQLTHALCNSDISLPRRHRAQVVCGGGAELQTQLGAGATCMWDKLPKRFS